MLVGVKKYIYLCCSMIKSGKNPADKDLSWSEFGENAIVGYGVRNKVVR